MIIPTLRYRDAAAAIDWLRDVFGFEQRFVVTADDTTIVHAQLVYRDSMIMVSQARDDAFGKLQRPPEVSPDGSAGPVTQSAYVVVEDADAHHDRAVASGARVVMALVSEDYGGRGYSCLDLEGHLWNFGTYNPSAE